MCATCTRDDAEFDFRLTEASVISSDDDVAHHGNFASATQCKTRNRCNDGLANTAQRFPIACDVVAFINVGIAVGGHCANISTRRKSFFITRQDDATNVGVCIEYLQSSAHLNHEFTVKRVQLLGAVKGDDSHFLCFSANLNQLVAHATLQIMAMSFN